MVSKRGAPKGFWVNRKAKEDDLHPLKEVFGGFEDFPAIRELLPSDEERRDFLGRVCVQVAGARRGYMRVSTNECEIIIVKSYLKRGDERSLYLDLIHELVHVKQCTEGRDIYDSRYDYVDRPTELEAYATAVKEARRLDMTEEEISDYLKVEWLDDDDHGRLLKNLKIRVPRRD